MKARSKKASSKRARPKCEYYMERIDRATRFMVAGVCGKPATHRSTYSDVDVQLNVCARHASALDWYWRKNGNKGRIVKVLTAAAVLAACGACGVSRSAPSVKIAYVQDGVPDAIKASTELGASAWSGLEIAGDQMSATQECDLEWFNTEIEPCTITVSITYLPKSEIGGAAGLTNHTKRSTFIAFELTGDALASVVAHEVGHSVFLTSDHLSPDQIGIMSASTYGVTVPTDADVTFAAAHTNGWVQP